MLCLINPPAIIQKGVEYHPRDSADVVAAEVVRSPTVKKNRVTAGEEMRQWARDGGEGRFFGDGTDGDRGVVEVVPHSDEVKVTRQEG